MKKISSKLISVRGRQEKSEATIDFSGRRYFLLEKLSHRGAYRAFDPKACPGGDLCALHLIPYSNTTQQKLTVLRRMSGPTLNRNFPRIIQCGRQGSDLLVITEWVWGTDLRHFLADVRQQKAPRPSPYEVIRLFRGLAHGLAHYHRRSQVIHGDVSPANIVVTQGTRNLALVDFGSAWPIERTAWKQIGDGVSAPYAAPERIADHTAQDFRSDQFSLSAVAYELLTLEIPYDGLGGAAGTPELVNAMTATWKPPSSQLISRRRLPQSPLRQIDDLFARSLALHADDRYPTLQTWLQAWDQLFLSLRGTNEIGWIDSFCRLALSLTPRSSAIYVKKTGGNW